MEVETRAIVRVGPDGRTSDRDPVVVEAPLELRDATGAPLTVTMRTPGHDDDLARGLLFAEGAFDDPAAAASLGLSRPPAGGEPAPARREDVLLVGGVDPAELRRRIGPRALPATSACGVCGVASIAALELRARPVGSDLLAAAAVIADLPGRLRAAQTVFAETGGLHGAGLFSPEGELIAVREDIGRHNAVDKLVGWALAAGRVPLGDCVLVVSGRLGFEIVHKAVVAGLPLVVAAKAPSSLAIDVAERFCVTLCGFTRGGRFNVYSHAARVVGPAPEEPPGASGRELDGPRGAGRRRGTTAAMGRMIEFKGEKETLSAYLAEPAAGQANGRGVVVLQEYWGLVPHIKDLADRFAAQGYVSLAPDLFHGDKTTNPDEAGRLLMALDIARVERDLALATEALVAEGGASGKVGVVGFCMGGQLALFCATTNRDRVGAVIDFYGIHPKVKPDYSRLGCPVLALFGENDSFVSVEAAKQLVADIEAAGKKVEYHIYSGAGHAFFNDARPEAYNAEAAADAWKRTLSFFQQNLA